MSRPCPSVGCVIPLFAWDPHPNCFRHRSCSKASPCGFCIGFAEGHWDLIEGERRAMLGLRPPSRNRAKHEGSGSRRKRGSDQGPVASLGSAGALEAIASSAPATTSGPPVVVQVMAGSSIESPCHDQQQSATGVVTVSPAPSSSDQFPVGQASDLPVASGLSPGDHDRGFPVASVTSSVTVVLTSASPTLTTSVVVGNIASSGGVSRNEPVLASVPVAPHYTPVVCMGASGLAATAGVEYRQAAPFANARGVPAGYFAGSTPVMAAVAHPYLLANQVGSNLLQQGGGGVGVLYRTVHRSVGIGLPAMSVNLSHWGTLV